METYIPFQSGPWKGRCAKGWEDLFRDTEKWLAENPGTVVVKYPCREVRRIETPQGVVYLKYIRALTDAGLSRKDLFSHLKWVLRPSRALCVWRASVALEAAGLECPMPVLAARKRIHGYPHDIIITREVPAKDCRAMPPGETPQEAAERIAQAAADLHAAGFAHGDFIMGNICVNPATGRFSYLDNDRTWRPKWPVRRHYQRRNLAQMGYSIARKFAAMAPCRAFLAKYAEIAGWPSEAERKRMEAAILKRNQTNHPDKPIEP